MSYYCFYFVLLHESIYSKYYEHWNYAGHWILAFGVILAIVLPKQRDERKVDSKKTN